MKLALLSDSHDNEGPSRKAAKRVKESDAELAIHLGDITTPDSMEFFGDLNVQFVFGNNDWDQEALQERAKELGIGPIEQTLELELAGKRIFCLHGDNRRLARHVLDSQSFDYLLHGHTHFASDEQDGATRVICPGALYRAQESSIAFLHLETGELEYEIMPSD